MESDLATTLYEPLKRMLQNWLEESTHVPPEIADLLIVQQLAENESLSTYNAAFRIVSNALNALEDVHDSAESLLRKRYILDIAPSALSHEMHMSVETYYRRQREAIGELAKCIARQECAARDQYAAVRELQLPEPPYDKLFGTEIAETTLTDLILSDESTDIITILGMGGIGKTSIAYAVSKTLLRHQRYKHLVWIKYDPPTLSGQSSSKESAFQHMLLTLAEQPQIAAGVLAEESRNARIHYVLKETPHLIIIDNVEEIEVAAYLYKMLPRYCNPTRFLITSRTQGQSNLPVYNYHLPELTRSHSFDLLRHIATRSNLPSLAKAKDDLLAPIFDLVGGNPLALRLSVGMLLSYPYSTVIHALSDGRLQSAKYLYARVYRDLWQVLSPESKRILTTMLINPSGVDGEQLQLMTNIADDAVFWEALDALLDRSLVRVIGPLQSRRYHIHQITVTFIQSLISGNADDSP